MSDIKIDIDIVPLPHDAVKLTAKTTGIDMPNEVFAIEVLPKSRDPRNVNYRFSHVCSLSELVEFPPEEDPEMCYFRTDDIEMLFDNINIALRTRDGLISDIHKLVDLYNAMQGLEPEPGPGPDDPDLIPDIYYQDL